MLLNTCAYLCIVCICLCLNINKIFCSKTYVCSLKIQDWDVRNPPVFLSSNLDVIKPKNGLIILQKNQDIILTCPGTKNTLKSNNLQLQSNTSSARCVSSNNLKINKHTIGFHDIQCTKQAKIVVVRDGNTCDNKQTMVAMHVGYPVTSDKFEKVIKVCYDTHAKITLYTEHNIQGSEINYAWKNKNRPDFSKTGLDDVSGNIPKAYIVEEQKETFGDIFGENSYVNDTFFLARGHLAPVADFLDENSQDATVCYVNVCPQWQNINAGNWKKLETLVRKTAVKYQENLRVYTGIHGVLSLPDKTGNYIKIYLLPEKKLAVPKFVWKIVYNEKTRQGIAIAILNNPFVVELRKKDVLCKSICERYGWYFEVWKDLKKGLVQCCTVGKLRSVVTNVPRISVDDVLRGIN